MVRLDKLSVATLGGMDDDTPDEVLAEFKGRQLGGWGVAQIAAGTGLAVYAMWVGILQPGFRKVPLRLQVPYLPASKTQVHNVMKLLRGRQGGLVDLGSGDGRIVLEAHRQGFTPATGYELNPWLVRLSHFHAWRAGHLGKVSYRREDLWKVNLSDCKNVTVFLAPSVLSLLQEKLQAELADDALVVAGRFPFPDWTPCMTEGHGVDRAWAYSMQAQRQYTCKRNNTLSAVGGDSVNELMSKEKGSTNGLILAKVKDCPTVLEVLTFPPAQRRCEIVVLDEALVVSVNVQCPARHLEVIFDTNSVLVISVGKFCTPVPSNRKPSQK